MFLSLMTVRLLDCADHYDQNNERRSMADEELPKRIPSQSDDAPQRDAGSGSDCELPIAGVGGGCAGTPILRCPTVRD